MVLIFNEQIHVVGRTVARICVTIANGNVSDFISGKKGKSCQENLTSAYFGMWLMLEKKEKMDKINILIVDDEVLLRDGLRSLLEKELFIDKIFEAGDEEGFDHQISSQHIDIILLDIRLRKTNGIQLLQKLDRTNPDLKVIAVTGLDGIENNHQSIEVWYTWLRV